jgi:hypothetical protein
MWECFLQKSFQKNGIWRKGNLQQNLLLKNIHWVLLSTVSLLLLGLNQTFTGLNQCWVVTLFSWFCKHHNRYRLIRLRSHITHTPISAPTLQKSSLAISWIDNFVYLALPCCRLWALAGWCSFHLFLMRNIHQVCYSQTCEFSFWCRRRVYLLTLLVCKELLYFLQISERYLTNFVSTSPGWLGS